MRNKAVIILAVIVLLATALLITHRSELLASAKTIEDILPLDSTVPTQSITCNSCTDCQTKLASGSYTTVTLTADIIDHEGNCIGLIVGESNVVFNCGGHTIDGDDSAIDPEHGVSMMHGTGNTIQNCTISDFDRGIYLWDATNHVVTNNALTSNVSGIEMGWSDSNAIHDNTSNDNHNGISISNSNTNTISSNVVCYNQSLDFNLASGSGNTGDNNNCDAPDGWNDTGTTGCTYACSGITMVKRLVAPSTGVARIGETVQFQIVLNNTGITTITHLPLRDTFDTSFLQFLDANPSPDSVTTGELKWNDLTESFGDLSPGRIVVVNLRFKAIASTQTQFTCNYAYVEGALDENDFQLPQSSDNACVEIASPCSEDQYEPNDDLGQAAPIDLGDEVKGLICPHSDYDFFQVANVAADTPLRVLLYDLPADYQLDLYGPDQGWILQSDNSGTTPEQIHYTTVASGTYYVRVAPTGAVYQPNRTYALRVLASSLKLSHLTGPPGTRVRVKGEGLFPGVGASPAEVTLYLDDIASGQELGQTPVRPDGTFDTYVNLPLAAKGIHEIIAANRYGGQLRATFRHFFDLDPDEVPISLDLWLDDAWFGDPKPLVKKVIGDGAGSAGLTIVDVVVSITGQGADPGNVAAEVTIDDDPFGPPVRAARRDSMGGELTTIAWTDRGDGTYSAETTLAPIAGGDYYREVVFRFYIPADVTPRRYFVEGAVWRHGSRVARTSWRWVSVWPNIATLIVTNRQLLYDQYAEDDVNWLLGQLYYHSQEGGLYSNNDLPAAIYYVDDYSITAANWNNTAVNWASEVAANAAANVVDDLIEDWYEDTSGDARYLLIVGDDNIIPFYRRPDPANAEADHPTVWNNHPVLNAVVSRDYFFTDNPYADMDDTDWDEGEIDLGAGRIVGPTAEELSNFLLNSLDGPTMDTDRAVLGTYGGRDFVLPGAGNDLAEALRDDRGLDLRNDSEVPVTVENDSWTEANFRNLMNLGFDVFHFQGHSENNVMEMASSEFFFDNEIHLANIGNAISDHRPFFYFGSACRAGFSLGTAWNDSLVYSLAHHDASGVIAAAGLSSSDWDDNEVYAAEQLANDFWQYTIRGTTGVALPMGTALRDVKRAFDPGSSWQTRERKALMEYTLFGVPWMRLPTVEGGTATHTASLQAIGANPPSVPQGVHAEASTYVATYKVDASDYQTTTAGDFDLVEVEGFTLSKGSDHPVVPVAELLLSLPPGSSAISVTVVPTGETDLGALNIPIFIPSVDYPGDPVGHYEETPDGIGVYPSELYMLDLTALESHQLARVSVIPLVYDAVSDQATLYQQLTVQVTYDAPVPVAITQLETSQPVYASSDVVDVAAVIANVGDTSVELTATLRIEDGDDATVVTQTAASFVVPGGASQSLALSWAGGLDQGDYTASLELQRDQGVVAQASTFFGVSNGGITDLSGSDAITPGGEAIFSLYFRNDRPEAVEAVAAVSIYDDQGEPVAELPPQLLNVGSGVETSATFTWTVSSAGTYWAEAIAAVGGYTYGPIVHTFSSISEIYLPIVLKNL